MKIPLSPLIAASIALASGLPAEAGSPLRDLEVAAGVTLIQQATRGIDTPVNGGGDVGEVSLSFDLETGLPLTQNSLVFAHLEWGHGAGIDERVPTLL